MQRTISAVVRAALARVTDARATVAVCFFDRTMTPPQHTKVGLADRALRDAMLLLDDACEALRGHGDGTQLPLLAV